MPRIRTFIAVELAGGVIRRARELVDKLRVAPVEVNWVRPEQMHLTLKFLGDVPDTQTPDICRVVAQVARQFEPFEIVFRGVGAFPSVEHPKVLWIGVQEGGQELKLLQTALDEALKSRLGYPLESRPFHPHLTVGRVKRPMPGGLERLTRILAEQTQFDADLTVIDEVVTFASFLSRQGPTHEALCRAGLGQR